VLQSFRTISVVAFQVAQALKFQDTEVAQLGVAVCRDDVPVEDAFVTPAGCQPQIRDMIRKEALLDKLLNGDAVRRGRLRGELRYDLHPPLFCLFRGDTAQRKWDQFALRSTIGRSEERRVGKECRSRWSPDH